MSHRRHHFRRYHNPFGTGALAPLATKVAGGVVGGIGAAVLPNMVSPGFAVGWAGVAAALIVAFGGSYLLRGMSANFSEGVLIGGTLQAVGRVAQLTIGKNIVNFSLSGYGPMAFPVPTPAYRLPVAAVPASGGGGSVTSPARGMGAIRGRGIRAVA